MKPKQKPNCKRKSVDRELAGRLSWINKELNNLNPPEAASPVKATTPIVTKTKTIPAINYKLLIISLFITIGLFSTLTLISENTFDNFNFSSLWDKFSGNEITGAEISVAPIEETGSIEEIVDNENNLSNNNITEVTQTEIQNDLVIQDLANATQCGTVNASITLTANVGATGTCFTLNTSNVTIDCQGYMINFSTAGSSNKYGFDNSDGYNNVTIKNCYIKEFETATSSIGIRFNNAANGTIVNNTIITNSAVKQSYGVYLLNSNNNVISNNSINTSGYLNYGLYLYGSSSNNLTNNKINTIGLATPGIYLTNSDFNYIIKNNVTTNGTSNAYGVYVDRSDSNTLINNTISTIGETSYGVHFYSATNSTLTGNTINTTKSFAIFITSSTTISDYNHSIDTTNTERGEPIYYYFNRTQLNVENLTDIGQLFIANSSNIIINNLTLDKDGIILMLTNNVTIQNTNISNPASNGIYSYLMTSGTIQNNNIYNTFGNGIYLEDSFTSNQIINNTIIGNNATASNYGAISLDNCNNTLINGNNLTTNFIRVFYIHGSNNIFRRNNLFNSFIGYHIADGGSGSINNTFTNERVDNISKSVLINTSSTSTYNNIFRDSTFSNNNYDLYLDISGSNITFINSSINKSKLYVYGGSLAYFKWYVDVNVTDTSQNSLEGANVSVYNSLGNLEDVNTTNSNGMARLILTEFYLENEINYYLTPSTIKASKNNYTENSTSVNLYNLTYASTNLTITEISCGDNISSNFALGNNYGCNTGFTINSNGITIDGNGYNLTGNGSEIGINLNGRQNVSITNLRISNFTQSIYFYNVNNSNLTSVTIINNTYGIIFNSSDNNKIYDSNFSNNYVNDVYATNTGGTSNYLVNYTGDVNNITVEGTAQVFLQWYVDVNANYTDANSNVNFLPNANASGLFNSTQTLDNSKLTDSNGLARLTLSELKRNSSGTYYLTPHNITLSYTTSSGLLVNFTYVNLTQTNNTNVNLSLNLDCTSPYTSMYLNNDTTFCPGIFTVDEINVNASNINLTCDGTTFRSGVSSSSAREPSSDGIIINDKSDVDIINCIFEDYQRAAIYMWDTSTNISIQNVNINSQGEVLRTKGIYVFPIGGSSTNISLLNSYISCQTCIADLYLIDSDNFYGFNNTFEGQDGVLSIGSHNGIFINNTFNELTRGVYFYDTKGTMVGLYGYSKNNTFYYNNFTSNTYNYYYFNNTPYNTNNTFNTSVSGYPQGNAYSDYCDKGTDTNGDGYADSGTASTYPYSENITTKISDPTDGNAGVVDYGPKIQTCPAAEVFLGSSSSSSSSSTSADSGSAPPAATESAPTATPAAATADSASFYSPAEAAQFLSSESETEFDELNTKIKFTLENTGTKRMLLFPQMLQEYDDPFFIITRKTLGSENSLFSQLSGMAYSQDTITGRLLKATLKNDEQIILEPGEKKETVLELEEGLKIPRQIKIQFTTLGEVVSEKTVEQKAFSGTAVDLDTNNNLMDLYVVIVPVSKQLEEYYSGNGNTPTGAAITDIKKNSDEYFLEFTINKNGSSFGDMYGPYNIKENQSLVFAQQLDYNPEDYSGINTIATKIYHSGKVIVEDEFEIDFGQNKEALHLHWLFFVLPLLLILLFLSGYTYNNYQDAKYFLAMPNSNLRIITPSSPDTKLSAPALHSKTSVLESYKTRHLLSVIGIILFLLALFALVFIVADLTGIFHLIFAFFKSLGKWLVPLIAFIILLLLIIVALRIKRK